MTRHIPEHEIREDIISVLEDIVTIDYAMELAENNRFSKLVREDVEACSAWEDEGFYNLTDVRLAIGRVMVNLAEGKYQP